ncbi:MAG: DUF4404 family protein [Gammaproteobacteria bacterium]|nr:DUF4404 family protein [Gammaproteobacteria bacterium]
MSRKELHELLDALRVALHEFEVGDQQARTRLDSLIAALERQIQTPNDTAASARLIANLPNAIEQFESKHPRLTAILNDLMVTLSGMGI